MTLDEQILAEAKEVRQHLVDLESQTAHARVDYHHAIKRLHAAGGSLREIADALELSHQRVHQIVDGPAGPPGGPQPWMRGGWKHGRRHRGGRNRQYFIARFDDGAREVMVEAQKEADSLRHPYLGTEHLMLALAKRGIEGVSYDDARKQVVEQVGEGEEQWIAGLPRPFTPRAKRVLEAALNDAVDAGREQFGPDDILLALVSDSRGAGGEILRGLGVTAEQLRGQPAK
jgi:Clp amino terminal domain, pathogenicity island component